MITGSGRPLAMQTRVTLLPSFTVTSEEMLEIFGGTVKTNTNGMCHYVSKNSFAALDHAAASGKFELTALIILNIPILGLRSQGVLELP